MTCGNPLRCDTCRRPSNDRGIVTHFDGTPGMDRARSRSSMAPLRFFSFFTRLSMAFSAHFSSSSPCFQPSSFFTAGLVNENRLFSLDIAVGDCISMSSVSIVASVLTIFVVSSPVEFACPVDSAQLSLQTSTAPSPYVVCVLYPLLCKIQNHTMYAVYSD